MNWTTREKSFGVSAASLSRSLKKETRRDLGYEILESRNRAVIMASSLSIPFRMAMDEHTGELANGGVGYGTISIALQRHLNGGRHSDLHLPMLPTPSTNLVFFGWMRFSTPSTQHGGASKLDFVFVCDGNRCLRELGQLPIDFLSR